MKKRKLMTKKVLALCLSLVILSSMFLVFDFTHAQTGLFGEEYGSGTGLGGEDRDLRDIIASLIRALLGFLGIVALIIILIGGVQWMTAGGAEDKVKDAQKRIGMGVIGLIIIFVAYAITMFVFTVIFEATQTMP